MTSTIEKQLPGNAFWKYFLRICAIPHLSGREGALRNMLVAEAEQHGLRTRTDRRGNLAIDRAAAPGCEKFPRLILQGHLDMVGQQAAGVEFDFLRDPIVPRLENGWVSTGGRTTLGADDGVALASAMELLCDPALVCGPLRAVFTVEEETGLGGALEIDPAFLDADILFNLDSDEDFTIGCAGGARLEGRGVLPCQAPTAGKIGMEFEVHGMHGGHSGEDIQRPYGSANRVLSDWLSEVATLELAGVDGGTLDNAIARDATASGVIAENALPELQKQVAEMAVKLNRAWTPAPGRTIEVSVRRIPPPARVLTGDAQHKLLAALRTLPHGVLGKIGEATETSANLAIVRGTAGGEWLIVSHVRSLFNDKRRSLCDGVLHTLQTGGLNANLVSEYSSWTPDWNAPLLKFAQRVRQELTGREPVARVTHGGLEPGLFSRINPELAMLSFAPTHEFLHSPQERLNVESVENFRILLRTLVTRLQEAR